MTDKKLHKHMRPCGEETRGKTAPNRLRRVDNFISMYASDLIKKTSSSIQYVFVDLGYGEYPITTIETACRLRKLNKNIKIIGVEIDKKRVEKAKPFTEKYLDFRYGGFNLPLKKKGPIIESATIIRAFNVLRQYKKEQVTAAYELLSIYLAPDGLLIEGTSDPLGRIWVANLMRKKNSSLFSEAILFSTNFQSNFHPENFQPVLPKNYIESMVEGEFLYQFFCSWKQAYERNSFLKSQKEIFKKAAQLLYDQGYNVNICKRFTSRGYLLLRK